MIIGSVERAAVPCFLDITSMEWTCLVSSSRRTVCCPLLPHLLTLIRIPISERLITYRSKRAPSSVNRVCSRSGPGLATTIKWHKVERTGVGVMFRISSTLQGLRHKSLCIYPRDRLSSSLAYPLHENIRARRIIRSTTVFHLALLSLSCLRQPAKRQVHYSFGSDENKTRKSGCARA